jgi:hypothetical protein
VSETSSGKSGSAAEWKKWWSKNRHRLCFDPEQQIYRVKDEYKKSPGRGG